MTCDVLVPMTEMDTLVKISSVHREVGKSSVAKQARMAGYGVPPDMQSPVFYASVFVPKHRRDNPHWPMNAEHFERLAQINVEQKAQTSSELVNELLCRRSKVEKPRSSLRHDDVVSKRNMAKF